MFFEDEKDNIDNTPDLQFNDEGTISWEGILGNDEDLVLSDSDDAVIDNGDSLLSFDEDVVQDKNVNHASANQADILVESDDIFAQADEDDIDDMAELSQILNNNSSPKQKAFDAFGNEPRTKTNDADVIDPDEYIDKQLAELDKRSEIQDNEVKISAPKAKGQQTPMSTVLLIALTIAVVIAFGVYMLLSYSKSKNLNKDSLDISQGTRAVQEQMNAMADNEIAQRNQNEKLEEDNIPVINEEETDKIKPDTVEKKEVIKIQPTGRTNPFMPLQKYIAITDLAVENPELAYAKSGIPNPPREIGEKNEPAIKMMTILVSGIMYDEQSPSAIITYDGNDYFVQKGDMLDEYKVVDIQRAFVKIALGRNIYKASVGEQFKISSEFYGNAQYLPEKQGGGRQYYSVGREYTSEKDVHVRAK